MARIMEPTPEQEAGYREWVAGRPAAVRAVAERFEPWSLYRMKKTGQRVTVQSFGEAEDGRVTLTVFVSAEYNLTLFERGVFGVDPDDLEPCDVPTEGELTGALMSAVDVENNIDALRVSARPDLWEMGPDGRAKWRGEGPPPDDAVDRQGGSSSD